MQVFRNTIFKPNVDAHWQPDGKSFRYHNDLQGGVTEYVYVDAFKGTRQIGTDIQRLVHNPPPQDSRNLHSRSISPDRREAYIQDGNVYVKATDGSGQPAQFTTDGRMAQPYGHLAWSPDSRYLASYRRHRKKNERRHD